MTVLYVVATPIGNLSDISLRAIEVLKSVDAVIVEDSRVSRVLLDRYGIDKKLYQYHEHSSQTQRDTILRELAKPDSSFALISDAGTPMVSDPGWSLVDETRRLYPQARIVPIPGASAVICALSAVGIPNQSFTFGGFIERKQESRKNQLSKVLSDQLCSVFFESPRRLQSTLETIEQIEKSWMHDGQSYTPAKLWICRELTKQHEQIIGASCTEALAMLQDGTIPVKGELVLVIHSSGKNQGMQEVEVWLDAFLEVCSPSKAAAAVAKLTKQPKKVIYELAMNRVNQSDK